MASKKKPKGRTLSQALAKDHPKGPGDVPKDSPRYKSAQARLKARRKK